MPRQAKTSEDELFALCDEIQATHGKVTAARLREAAGGGSHNRLKAAVEAWQARHNESAKQAEDDVQEKAGRGRGRNGKSQGKVRGAGLTAGLPAKEDTPRRRGKTAAKKIAFEDTEQTEI